MLELVNRRQKQNCNSTLCNLNDIMFIQGQAGVVHNIVNDNPDVVSLFAFTQRISADTTNVDGTVTKTNVFKHQKFMKY